MAHLYATLIDQNLPETLWTLHVTQIMIEIALSCDMNLISDGLALVLELIKSFIYSLSQSHSFGSFPALYRTEEIVKIIFFYNYLELDK